MGRFHVKRVGRDLGVSDLSGDARAERVEGDIRLRTAFAPDGESIFKADGDIIARVPPNANADLTLRSGRGQPRIKANLEQRVETDNQVTGRLGDGGADVLLEADRDLVFSIRGSDVEGDWSEFGVEMGGLGAEFGVEFAGLAEEIGAQIEAQMAEMSAQLEEKLAAVAEWDERAARAAEKAQRQAEKAAERLRRVAEQQVEKARRRAQKARVKSASRPSSRAPEPEPASEPVSDDERMTILNMVAEGKITVEEAETLLEALGSR
jgi:hypothetical protein